MQMLGACGGCPASTMTLKGAIETIVRADVIFVVDRGRIVESGTHDELLRRGGAYAALYGRHFAMAEAS